MKKSRTKNPHSAPPRNDWRQQDSSFESEGARYAEPIPSREHLRKTLTETGRPMSVDDLVGHFQLRKLSEQEALAKRLHAMSRAGELSQNRRGAYFLDAATAETLIAGKVQAHRDGFGFLLPEGEGPDVFLPPHQMRTLMNGDRIKVRVTGTDQRGRLEGAVAEVIERASRQIVGRVHEAQGVVTVIPTNARSQQEVLIPPKDRFNARHGQIVVAEILAPAGRNALPMGKIKEILGEHLSPGMEIEVALRAHDLPHVFPHAVEQEAAALPDVVRAEDCKGREDLRDLPLVTIDGSDARDFDDAVFARPEKKEGWTLWVAIADVSAYVKPGKPLDTEAHERGTSVYFPRQVIPMLPEKLSNGLCSLNPHVDRLCMVCEMRVMPDGEIAQSRFYEAVMNSKARLVYEDVAVVIDPQFKGDAGARKLVPEAVVPHLRVLDEVFAALFAARERRGAIDFDSTETKILFSDGRKIDRIVPVQRNRAHRLIEECMVAANVEAAKRVEGAKIPALFRVHEQPDPLKIKALREFMAVKGLSLGGGDKPQARDLAKLSEQIRARPDAATLQTTLLRSLMQARYQPENIGHFGLALTHYAHFTSPIRRYPDLLLHRALKHAIRNKKPATFQYTPEQMSALGEHCSTTERRADDATRDVAAWLKCEFMSHRVGDELTGSVSAVTSFGLFVDLTGLYIEGLIHISNLKSDFYEFDASRQRLVGKRLHQVYSLGDRIRVRVVRVNMDERKIDLELVEKIGSAPKSVTQSAGVKIAPVKSRGNGPAKGPKPSQRSKKRRRS